MTDQEYIQAFLVDDQKAFTKFYHEHRKGFICSISNAFSFSDDDVLISIYIDSCMRLWTNIQNHKLTVAKLTSTLAGYLYGIGIKVMLEYINQKKNSVSFEPFENVFASEPIDDEDDTEKLRVAAKRALLKMKEPCIKLLTKFYFEKMNWDAIAQELGYSSSDSAKTQKNKCMNKLKEEAQIQLQNINS